MLPTRFEHGTMWFGVDVPNTEERLRLDSDGRPLGASVLGVLVESCSATNHPDGTISIKATLKLSELKKLSPVAGEQFRIDVDPNLPAGAQEFGEFFSGGQSGGRLVSVASVHQKPAYKGKFVGACLYSARVTVTPDPGDLYLVTARGFAAVNRLGPQSHVGYIGDHASG